MHLAKQVGRFERCHMTSDWLPGYAGGQGSGPAADADNSQDPLAQYPDGGYWRLAPGIRLRMLRALCHDALSTAVIRSSQNTFAAAVHCTSILQTAVHCSLQM